MSTAEFGVYVHIPFCRRRCDYCAFATWTDRHHLHKRYADACRRELAEAALPPASSVFFGGGTPSLLDPRLLASILADVVRRPGAEVTVECNPDTVTPDLLAAYRDAGVTRLSFGVQSLVDHVLAALGREHDPASVRRAVALAGQYGYGERFNVDLIYGAAGESLDDWRATVKGVLSLDPAPAHVSAYALTVEPGTPLATTPERYPDGDDQADKYDLADDLLGEAGLGWYEVSNWARPGKECRHNQLYWECGSYRGIGASAHSHQVLDGGRARRWWNVRTPDRYCNLVEGGRSIEAAGDDLEARTRATERLMLALRTRSGVPAAALADDDPALVGLVFEEGGRKILTRRGRLLANEVALRLEPVPVPDHPRSNGHTGGQEHTRAH